MERMTANQVPMLAHIAEIRRIFTKVATRTRNIQAPAVIVTSARRGEGKTTLTALLAATAAVHTRRRVLALDLNWHQPALHSCFGLERTFDVEAFCASRTIKEQIRSSGIPGLDVLPAPPPTQIDEWHQFDALEHGLGVLEQARAGYDWVIADSTAVYPANRYMIDPVVLAEAASGVIVTVLAGITSRHEIKRTLANLETAGVDVLGTVVNQWRNRLLTG